MQFPHCARPRGFTLIEVIGVLVIIGILAAVAVTTIIKRVDKAAADREVADLNTIADAYVQSALRTKVISGTVTWASEVASHIAMPINRVTNTSRGYARAFLIDPNLNIGGSGLPYTQTSAGSTNKPLNPRVMFVSSLARALPIATGAPSAAEFNAIWNTADGSVPATATWAGWNGEDLRIKRVNLEPQFHQVILIDRDPTGPATVSIDRPSTFTIPTNGLGWNSYYLDGTIVGLHSSNNVVMTRHLLKRSISFVFERGSWRGQITGRLYSSGSAAEFADKARSFFATDWNSNPRGSSQLSVIVAMYGFMFNYTLWANECPAFGRHGNTGSNPQGVPEYDILNAYGADNGFIDTYSDDNTGILKKPNP